MSSLNSVKLMGNLGNDPELRFTPSGTPVCTFRLATNEYYTDKAGKGQTRTEWHKVVVWGKAAQACSNNLKKGRLVLVEGRLQTRNWKDKNGVTHYTTEIVSARTQFLPSGGQKVEPVQAAAEAPEVEEEQTPSVPMNVRDML